MKTTSVRNLILLLFFISAGVSAQEKAVIGKWWDEEKSSQIRIFKATNGKYYGKIEYLSEDPDATDVNNPDEGKRNDPILSLIILKDFEYDAGNRKWQGGTIYDPNNGKTYDCYMWFDDNPDLLYIKGYVLGMKFLGRETLWEKVKE